MRADILTKEYPPNVYGGAGVHVQELVKALRSRGDIEVQVRAFGEPVDEPGTTGYPELAGLAQANATLKTLGQDVAIAADVEGADLVHSHTWYANMAGHLGSLLAGVPHVISAHSLEPLRPWKAEQLGGGYRVSSWIEKTAYEAAAAVIAVSHGMRADILKCYPSLEPDKVKVVHNGIDSDMWSPDHSDAGKDIARELGMDPDGRSIVFVGRQTRQKGLPYMLRAAKNLPDDVQLVLCAGAPDTPEVGAEIAGLMKELQETRRGVVYIPEHLPRHKVIALESNATVFACPSIYEPLGIVNLEAMACEAAVIATATGGIPEVVVDGETGWLVEIEQVQDGSGTPLDEAKWIKDLGDAMTEAVADPEEARKRGLAGRKRAVEQFSWNSIGDKTMDVYTGVLGS